MLPLSSLRSQPRSLHLLHHHLLLFQRGLLTLHRRLMLLHHGVALLCQRCSHSLNRSCVILPIALRGGGGGVTCGGAISLETQKEPLIKLVRLETHLKHDKEGTTKAKQTHNPQTKERRLCYHENVTSLFK